MLLCCGFVLCCPSARRVQALSIAPYHQVCMREGEQRQSLLLQGHRRGALPDGSQGSSAVVAAHPQQPLLAVGGRWGLLQLLDIDSCLVRNPVMSVWRGVRSLRQPLVSDPIAPLHLHLHFD